MRAGVKLPEGKVEATTQGVPQGGPLSPLLANIMLDPLDKELESRGLRFARYADDFLILVKSLKAARRVMQSVTRFIEVRLRALDNRWLSERGVPNLRQQWVAMHYGRKNTPTPEAVNLTGTACRGPA